MNHQPLLSFLYTILHITAKQLRVLFCQVDVSQEQLIKVSTSAGEALKHAEAAGQ